MIGQKPATLQKKSRHRCFIVPFAKHSEAATRGVLCKKVFLEISQNSQENTCAKVSLLIKLQAIKKVALAQVLSCEFYEISKNIFFTENHWATASEHLFMSNLSEQIFQNYSNPNLIGYQSYYFKFSTILP